MRKRAALTVLAVVASLMLGAGAAHADSAAPDVAPEVARALEAVPGGVVIDYWTAEWPAQNMRLDAPRSADIRVGPLSISILAVGSCQTGRICAYANYGLAGTKLSWTSCGIYSTAALGGPVRSIANARSSGLMYARYGSTTVAYAGAGSWSNVTRTATSVSC